MPEHTPGPWTAQPETLYSPNTVTWNARKDPIAEVFGPSRDDREANARLIAAAPDLLEALQDALEVMGEWGDEGEPAWAARARAAIAKAEGRI